MQALALALLLQAAPAPAEEVDLVFAWPKTGSVRVDARLLANEEETQQRFLLFWSPDRDTRGIVVRQAEYELVSARGLPATDPSLLMEATKIRWMYSSLPGMYVDAEGQVSRFTSWPDSIRDTVDFMRNTGATDKQMQDMRYMYEQEGFGDMVTSKLGEAWNAWVGAFAGQTLELGVAEESRQEQPIPGSSRSVRITQKTLCEEIDSGSEKRHVRVRIEMRTDPGDLRAAFYASGQAPPGVEPVEALEQLESVFDLDTLRPLSSSRVSLARWKTPEGPVDQREVQTYTFHWTDLRRN